MNIIQISLKQVFIILQLVHMKGAGNMDLRFMQP